MRAFQHPCRLVTACLYLQEGIPQGSLILTAWRHWEHPAAQPHPLGWKSWPTEHSTTTTHHMCHSHGAQVHLDSDCNSRCTGSMVLTPQGWMDFDVHANSRVIKLVIPLLEAPLWEIQFVSHLALAGVLHRTGRKPFPYLLSLDMPP